MSVLYLCGPALAQTPRRNFLVLALDDVGIEHLRPFGVQDGDDYADTSNLDDLDQNQLLRFDGAWSLPWCSSTRALIHTGLLPMRLDPSGKGSGVGIAISDEDTEWGLDSETHTDLLPQLLHDDGYETGIFGKWHMGTEYPGINSTPCDICDLAPSRAGYDEAEVILRRHNPEPFSYFDYMVTDIGGSEEDVDGVYHTTDTVDRASAWINGQTGPWFAWVAFYAAHGPWDCPPDELIDEPCTSLNTDEEHYRFVIEALDNELRRFLDDISWDAAVDPLKNNTVLFILSDNGSPHEVAHSPVNPNRAKGTVFEGGVRVPFWIGGAGVTPGEVSQEKPVTVADVYATILDVAGIDNPHIGLDIDSTSLRPYFDDPDPAAPVRQYAYTEAFSPNTDPAEGPDGLSSWTRAVRNSTRKYVKVQAGGNQEALYDIINDPWETTNLINVSWEHNVREELKSVMSSIYPPPE